MNNKRKIIFNTALILMVGFSYLSSQYANENYSWFSSPDKKPYTELPVISQAFKNQQSNIQISQQGTVFRLLADDLRGSRHQKFLVRLDSGQNLLIVHNIDLAPRVPGLKVGTRIAFNGEYEWNKKGGLVHWTHPDPQGKHEDGWLEYQGKRYQ